MQSQLGRIANAQALFRRIDEKHPPKTLTGQTADGLVLIAVEQHNRLAATDQIQYRRDPRDTCPHYPHFAAVFLHRFFSLPSRVIVKPENCIIVRRVRKSIVVAGIEVSNLRSSRAVQDSAPQFVQHPE